MSNKLYGNFYDCIYDLGTVLGISHLKDMPAGIKFAQENGYPEVAKYFKENADRLNRHIDKEFEEFEDAGNANIGFSIWET